MSITRHPPKDRKPQAKKHTFGRKYPAKNLRYWSKTTALSSVTTATREWFERRGEGWGVSRSSPSMISFRRPREGGVNQWDEVAVSYSYEGREWCVWASWGSSWGGEKCEEDASWRSMRSDGWDPEEWEGLLEKVLEGFKD